MIKRIHVTYHLKVDDDADHEKIERAFQATPNSCPVYRSIHPQIEVTTALDLI